MREEMRKSETLAFPKLVGLNKYVELTNQPTKDSILGGSASSRT